MKQIFSITKKFSSYLYLILAFLCLTSWITPPLALFLGLIFSLTFGLPFQSFTKKASKNLLQISIIGLGFGMNLHESLKTGSDGIIFTIISVISVLVLGIFLGNKFKVDKKTSYLIASGTAICGGSAIAAVGPVSKADPNQMSIALATIFVLNAIALFVFPILGIWLNLNQQQFGIWSAIAIHDTSSVVGASAAYGNEALQIATTVKLTRALWIIPLTLFTSYYFKSKGDKIYIPWFILFFIIAMLINTYIQIPANITSSIISVSKQCLTLTLFFIGAGLTKQTIRAVGAKPLILGISLWFFIAISSLAFIYFWY